MTAAVQESETVALALVPSARPIGLLRPIAKPADVVIAQEETRELISKALKKDRDYGLIKGTGKETLFKAGAERVILAFGCFARFRVVEKEIDHNVEVRFTKTKKKWNNKFRGDKTFELEETQGLSHGLYRYVVECEIVHRESGEIVGSFQGSCSTMESKYIDRPRDCENTVLKMAEKRGLVGACLTTFGLSDQFTQDVEDMPREGGASEAPAEVEDAQVVEEMTLATAMTLAFPGEPGTKAWGGNGGKPLHSCNTKHLESIRKWCATKIEENGDDPEKQMLIDAITLILIDRDAAAPKEPALALDDKKPAEEKKAAEPEEESWSPDAKGDHERNEAAAAKVGL